jgi:hypothetical protein
MAEAWKWQLRDRLGQWMDMHSEVRWLSRGQFAQGTVVGSPREGWATVKESGSGQQIKIPTHRLTAISLPPGKVPPPSKPSIPQMPKRLSSLSNGALQKLYWQMRDHPDVPTRRWLRVALEIHKRKIDLEPHSGGGVPAGVFASGAELSAVTVTRQMEIRLLERELALR